MFTTEEKMISIQLFVSYVMIIYQMKVTNASTDTIKRVDCHLQDGILGKKNIMWYLKEQFYLNNILMFLNILLTYILHS